MVRRVLTAAVVALTLSAGVVFTAGPATGAGASVRHACAVPGRFHCFAEVVVLPTRPSGTSTSSAFSASAVANTAYSAADLQAIYQTAGLKPAGGKPTIAIVDAFDYPTAASDLAVYRKAMGLPPCTVASGCLSIVSQTLGSTSQLKPAPYNNDWTLEAALDLDMASAICPDCNLMLVEAKDDTGGNLFTGALNAALVSHYVSMSWGGQDVAAVPADLFTHSPGTTFVAATGDFGYESTVEIPSSLTNVVGAGGVSLSAVGGTPTAWDYAGSGCSTRVPQPAPQTTLTTGCAYKATSDLSALADPQTGVAVYDSYNSEGGWNQMGGTSAAAPIVAALYALVGNHTDPWTGYEQLATYPSLMADVTSGSNGSCGAPLCDAGVSWDGPTGIGMPLSPEAVALPLGDMNLKTTTLTGAYQDDMSVSVPIKAPDTAGTPQTLASSDAQVTGLPDGVSASAANGVITFSGMPTTPGTGTATVTLTGTTPGGRTASGTVSLAWTITPATLVPDGDVQILGHRRHGGRVHVALPTLFTNSLSGTEALPTWTVKWFLDGKLVHVGMRYRLPRHSQGQHLRVKARAVATDYYPLTLRSARVTVR